MPFIETVGKLLKNTKDKILSIGKPSEKEVSYAEITKSKTQEEKIEVPVKTEKQEVEVEVEVEEKQEPKVAVLEKATEEKKVPKTKKASTSKTTAKKTTISKKDAKIALYHKDITKHYEEVDTDLLALIVKNLGPSIYRKNAELVSCGESKELDTVRKNFLIKKLGLEESTEVLDAAIQEVCQELKGVRQKYRATFYYRLAQKFNKASALS
jgi:hypothetical protein